MFKPTHFVLAATVRREKVKLNPQHIYSIRNLLS